jgi:hypothetical protein
VRLRRPIVAIVLAMMCVVSLTIAQTPLQVFPLGPRDDAVVGPFVLFRVGYRGIADDQLRQARFRIELRGVDDPDRSFVFDQRRHGRGWTPGAPGLMLYRPARPLPDGSYRWTVAVWDGVDWKRDDQQPRLRVDSVPPAEVEDLIVRYDAQRRVLELEWDPVALDREGGPEYVRLYRVYRYARADRTPRIEPFEILETDYPEAEIPVSGPEQAEVWYFRVTAVDMAGNEAGRPE